MDYFRGDIYWVNLEPVKGKEMKKVRPAIIVSNEIINKFAAVIVVCPLTDSLGKKSAMHIPVAKGEGGLTKDSIIHCAQIRAVDKSRLAGKIGTVSQNTLARISEGLKWTLSF